MLRQKLSETQNEDSIAKIKTISGYLAGNEDELT